MQITEQEKANAFLELLLQGFRLAAGVPRRDYRAAHALRGTPPRLRANVHSVEHIDEETGESVAVRVTRGERKTIARARALETFNRIAVEGVHPKYLHSSRRAA